ncbi:hypothetical protein ACFT8P_18905 [Streptomyces sp. NPDC057101]|uniref:hypothetical protein n=1 Tax=Streptomyces sp. NPDC057101 TaxID=3346020 RepID=UPI003628F4AE
MDMALLWAHPYDQLPELSGNVRGLAPAVDNAMAKAMVKAADDRYGSCREFVAELASAASGRAS